MRGAPAVRRRPVSIASPPDTVPTVRSRSVGRPSRPESRLGAVLDVPVVADDREVGSRRSPAATARSARTRSAIPSRSATVLVVSSGSCCGRYAVSPLTFTMPALGVSSPAIIRSRVDLPDPLRPIRPVRPDSKVTSSPDRTGTPSGHAKQRTAAGDGHADSWYRRRTGEIRRCSTPAANASGLHAHNGTDGGPAHFRASFGRDVE